MGCDDVAMRAEIGLQRMEALGMWVVQMSEVTMVQG